MAASQFGPDRAPATARSLYQGWLPALGAIDCYVQSRCCQLRDLRRANVVCPEAPRESGGLRAKWRVSFNSARIRRTPRASLGAGGPQFEPGRPDHVRVQSEFTGTRCRDPANCATTYLIRPDTRASHHCIRTFLGWAEAEGFRVDGRMLWLPPPKRARKAPTLYQVTQVRTLWPNKAEPHRGLAAVLSPRV